MEGNPVWDPHSETHRARPRLWRFTVTDRPSCTQQQHDHPETALAPLPGVERCPVRA